MSEQSAAERLWLWWQSVQGTLSFVKGVSEIARCVLHEAVWQFEVTNVCILRRGKKLLLYCKIIGNFVLYVRV